jgi:GT2 family glycosyltransferase
MNTNLVYQTDDPVSVVLICHNKADNLVTILGSLATNTRRPDLVVLSDDGSDDGSVELFRTTCAQGCLNHVVIDHPRAANFGPAFRINSLRNDGIRACPRGLVVVLDADLLPGRTHIESHVQMHALHPQQTVISTGPRLESANPDGSGPVNFMWGHEPVAMIQPSPDQPIPSWTAMPGSLMAITTGFFEHMGGFDTDYDGHYGFDDMDFMYRASQTGVFFAGDFGAYVIHLPHRPVFAQRTNERNRKLFQSKHGFDVYTRMPSLYRRLGRSQAWSELYPTLRDGGVPMATPLEAPLGRAPVNIMALDMGQIDGRVLLSIGMRRFWRKFGRLIGLS